MSGLDPHLRPPDEIRLAFKKYQRAAAASLDLDPDVFDPANGRNGGFVRSSAASRALGMPADLLAVLQAFLNDGELSLDSLKRPAGYKHPDLPGLYVFPALLPPEVQLELLDRMFHRDTKNPQHLTNLHMHYDIRYPRDQTLSFFDKDSTCIQQIPKDPSIHKPFDVPAMLQKKLRWITLGGQYDWTQKKYPDTVPPPFPPDIAALNDGLFPSMRAEAAILNLYSPGDTLSLHRDVSEFCNAPLTSISLGCDGIFMAGLGADDGRAPRFATMRLRSGDVAIMSGESRYAWHGVPKIVAGTCPSWMADWPCLPQNGKPNARFDHWKGWMGGKRVNLNIRQMYAREH